MKNFKIENPTPALYALIDALEGGEYRQTTRALFNGEAHCCLGVAAEVVHGKDIWILHSADRGLTVSTRYRYESCENDMYINLSSLAGETARKLGLNLEVEYEMIKRNDSGQTFKEIATYLRSIVV